MGPFLSCRVLCSLSAAPGTLPGPLNSIPEHPDPGLTAVPCSLVGWQVHGDPTQPPLPLLTVNQELVRRVHGKDTLVVHSNMERDVGLLRLYPGIPAALVESPEHPLPSQRAPGYCEGT